MRTWGKRPSEEAFERQQRLLTAAGVLLSVGFLALSCEGCGGGPHRGRVVTGAKVQAEQMPSGDGSSRRVCVVGLGCQEQWK